MIERYPTTGRKTRALLAIVLGFKLSGCVALKHDTTPYQLTMMSQQQVEGPCVASLVGAPAAGCLPWEPNVSAHPTYEPSRRLVFSGAGDALLHISDADSGRPLAKVVTAGRVITKTVFGNGNAVLFFGTDKGKFYCLDAYTFQPIFSLNADSKINDNITVVGATVVFTSAVGTIYAVDTQTGIMKWHLAQPLAKERLRLSHQSSIFAISDKTLQTSQILVPHNDGFISVIDTQTGKLIKRIELGLMQGKGFPDIVAPMVRLKNRLWVASHDLGIAIIDLTSLRIREQISLNGVLAIATDGDSVFAATSDALFRLNDSGDIMWKNDISSLRSRVPRAAFPFEQFSQGAKRMFFGVPTGMLVDDKRLILSYSLGSIGIFDKSSGRRMRSLGHSIGYSALEWAGASSFMAVSKRGLLMKFQG